MSNEATHQTPGEFVRAALEAKGWTQTDLAYALGTTTASVNQILSNKRGISGNMARALGVALDRLPEEFARVQAEWDVRHADAPEPIVAARSKVLTQYPLREMVKRGWIDPDHGKGSLEDQVCGFFGVESIDDIPHLTHSAKKTSYTNVPPTQLAWLFRVRQIASEMPTVPYDRQKLERVVEMLSDLRSDPKAVRHVPRLLSEAGVRFVVVEGLPGGKIHGVCFWLNESAPVIGLSLRFDRIDNFWFVLRHECAHVLHGHGRDTAIVDADLDFSGTTALNDEEQIANSEAAEFCIPSDKIRSFYMRKRPFFADVEVMAFAKRMNVHPGLVVGQLQRMIDRYDFLRKHLVAVREHLAHAMMMDGWGDVVPVER